MKLKTLSNNEPYFFEVTLFRDEEEEQLLFLVETQDNDIILAEKKTPKGEWHSIGELDETLRNAIFKTIDTTSVQKLVEAERPFSELNGHYVDLLRSKK